MFLDPDNIPYTSSYAEHLAKRLENRLYLKPIIVVLQPWNQHQHIIPANPKTPIIYGPPVYKPEINDKHLDTIPPEYRGTINRQVPHTPIVNDLESDPNSAMTAEDAHHWKYFTNLIIGNRWNKLNRQSQFKPQSLHQEQ